MWLCGFYYGAFHVEACLAPFSRVFSPFSIMITSLGEERAGLLWILTVTCSCCPYLYFGSAIMLVTYFVNFR